jgi:ABC-2 type transport system permease protein
MGTAMALIRTKLAMLAVLIFDTRRHYLARNIAMALTLAMLVGGSYYFFRHLIFGYVITIEDIGQILIDRLVAVGFLIFFFLLVVSSIVTSLGALYRTRETEYLFSTPLPIQTLFAGKFIDIVVYSSWSILIMALPILVSYAQVRAFRVYDYAIAGILILLPYILAATSIGALLAILFRYFAKHLHPFLLSAAGIALFGGLLVALAAFSGPTRFQIQFTEDFRALNLFINNFNLNDNPFLPNYWFVQGLAGLAEHSLRTVFLYAGALITTAGLALSLLALTVERLYFHTWLASLESRYTGSIAVTSGLSTQLLVTPPRSQEHALLAKDLLMFIREPTQWSQLIILLVLLGLYFTNLTFIPGDIELPQWRTILFLMNLSICGLVMATLAVRFVYPAISLEGDSFWVIASAPLSTRTIFREKLGVSFIVFFITTQIIGIISSYLLALEDLYRFITFAAILLMSLSLSALAVGFGAAFPDFSERNPGKIVSSPGGVLTVTVSLTYVAAMVAITAFPIIRYTTYLVSGGSFPLTELILSTILAICLNMALLVWPLLLGARTFMRREF